MCMLKITTNDPATIRRDKFGNPSIHLQHKMCRNKTKKGIVYTLFLIIRTSKSGPEAQLFLISNLIVTLLRGVGHLLYVKNDHENSIYDYIAENRN